MSWQEELSELDQEAHHGDGNKANRQRPIACRFLREEVYPSLRRISLNLKEQGYGVEMNPREMPEANDELRATMLVVRKGERLQPIRSPIAFRAQLLLEEEVKFIIDYQQPYDDDRHFESTFGFLSGDFFRKRLNEFLTYNELEVQIDA